MTDSNVFDSALGYLLGDEGVTFTDDPQDSGGPTKFGITLHSYQDFAGALTVTKETIRNLTLEDARIFYLQKYWLPLSAGGLTDEAMAISIFDTSVLYGVKTAIFIAQKTLCSLGWDLTVDGVMGPETLGILNMESRCEFLDRFIDRILTHIDAVIQINPKDEKFRQGWTRRAQRLMTLKSQTLFMIKTNV